MRFILGARKVSGRSRKVRGRCMEGVMPMISLAVVGTLSQ